MPPEYAIARGRGLIHLAIGTRNSDQERIARSCRTDARGRGTLPAEPLTQLGMLANPRLGQRVQLWYAKRYAHTMPLHGKVGTVVIVGKGKPRNHGVKVDGVTYCVPCGNMNKIEERHNEQR